MKTTRFMMLAFIAPLAPSFSNNEYTKFTRNDGKGGERMFYQSTFFPEVGKEWLRG